jgi:CheY-like chemotaxis protein
VKRNVVLALNQDEEREVIHGLLHEEGFHVHLAHTGYEAFCLVEDHPQCFLITDVQLSDMTVWGLLGKLREIVPISALQILVLANEPQVAHPAGASVTVVVRPVAITILRQLIQKIERS